MKISLLAGVLLVAAAGPFDIPLRNTATVPGARGSARLVYAASPFGVEPRTAPPRGADGDGTAGRSSRGTVG